MLNTMNYLKEAQKFWCKFPKYKAEKTAFYSIFKKDGVYYVSMFYGIESAREDARYCGGKVYSYNQILRMCGSGKTLFFHNFYLS